MTQYRDSLPEYSSVLTVNFTQKSLSIGKAGEPNRVYHYGIEPNFSKGYHEMIAIVNEAEKQQELKRRKMNLLHDQHSFRSWRNIFALFLKECRTGDRGIVIS